MLRKVLFITCNRTPSCVTDGGEQSSSSENMQNPESDCVRIISTSCPAGVERRLSTSRTGPKPWPSVVLSILGSVVAVAALGSLCALLYPILKELRAERVIGEDGTEEKMLGFWSILVLSVLVGCICSVFSWTLTYLDSGMVFPTTLSLRHISDVSGHSFHMAYGVAVLNGIMAMLTVVWSLS